jgi:hypothetical protein
MVGIKTSSCGASQLVKFTLEQAMKAQRGSRGIALLFLSPRRKMGVGDERQVPAALPPGDPVTTVSGWVGHRAGLDGCRKSPDHPASSERLYRLRYAGSRFTTSTYKKSG